MANSWTKNDYNRNYGEDDERRERQYRQERAYGTRGRRFDAPRQFGGGYEEDYGYGYAYGPDYGSYEYRRTYGRDMNRDGERDARFRDVARFERESNFGGDRDPEWHPYGGRSRRHMRDMQHGDDPRNRDFEREWDRETDRGAWNRSRDEVSSWFGDEDAKRRRHRDEMRDDMRHEREDEHRGDRSRRYGRYA